MSSFDKKITSVLVRTVPLPTGAGRDWEDVLARAEVSTRIEHTRRLLYSVAFAAVLAVVLAATPLGAVIAHGFGDFSEWLSGKPGQPASVAEQKTIERGERRLARYSWTTFPKGAKLRRLITVTRDGIEYKLFGYRAGDMFCLRLSTPGALLPYASCAPKSELTRRMKPALALYVDAPVFEREKTDWTTELMTGQKTQLVRKASVTFGIVSDGVTSVRGLTRSSILEGIVAADSFLIVTPRHEKIKSNLQRPRETLGFKQRLRSIVASDAAGDKVKTWVAGVDNEYATGALAAPLSGPKFRMAKRQVTGVKIAWLERREPRGTPLSPLFWLTNGFPQCGLECKVYLETHDVVFSRQLAPDPGGVVRIAVSLRRNGDACFAVAFPRRIFWLNETCIPKQDLSSWSRSEASTFHVSLGMDVSNGNQYYIRAGLVDDHVRRMTLFFSSGKQTPVVIRDNAYVYGVPATDDRVRLVAFNSANRVVGVDAS